VGDGVIRLRNEDRYRERFAHFSKFYNSVKNEPYPLDYASQGIIHHLPSYRLVVLGLNSAWNLDHHFTTRAGIDSQAVSMALGEIRRNRDLYEGCFKMAVFHHPLVSPEEDRIKDHGFMDRLANAGFCLALHGHIHKADKDLYSYDVTADGRKLHVIGAGTFGAPVKQWTPGYPLQYNLLRLSGKKLTVETRCRREINGAWCPDAIWRQGAGNDPLPRYFIDLAD
jgi:hypothetical protein